MLFTFIFLLKHQNVRIHHQDLSKIVVLEKKRGKRDGFSLRANISAITVYDNFWRTSPLSSLYS